MAYTDDWAQRFWRNISYLIGRPTNYPDWTQPAGEYATDWRPFVSRDAMRPYESYLNNIQLRFSPVVASWEQPSPSGAAEVAPAQIQLTSQDPSIQWYYEFTRQHGGVTPEVYYGGPAAQYDPEVAANALEQAIWDREWGKQFERTYGRPPSEYDWKASYWHRLSRYLAGETPYGGWHGLAR